MKKVFVLLFVGIMLVSFNSCTKKKPENLADLKAKYEKVEFKDCDDAVVGITEIFDVYFLLLDKAYNGDEKAKEDFMQFDKFLSLMGEKTKHLETKCADKFEIAFADFQKKLDENMNKVMKVAYGDENLMNDLEEAETSMDTTATDTANIAG